MAETDKVGITFVNGVLGRGIMNNIVNLQLGACLFEATPEGAVDPSMSTVCRLRMDLLCAEQLHAVLGELLTSVNAAQAQGSTAEAEGGLPN